MTQRSCFVFHSNASLFHLLSRNLSYRSSVPQPAHVLINQQCKRKIAFIDSTVHELRGLVGLRRQNRSTGFVQEFTGFDRILPKV